MNNLDLVKSVEIEFLNCYSDDIRARVYETVAQLAERDVAHDFLVRIGADLNTEEEDVSFMGEGEITCKDMNVLENALLVSGDLTDEIKVNLRELRTDYARLFYFDQKMREISSFSQGLMIIKEMHDAGICPNREIVYNWAAFANDFDQFENIYRMMIGKDSLCKVDAVFLDLWLVFCKTPDHYKKVYLAMKAWDIDASGPLMDYWVDSCDGFDEIKDMFDLSVPNEDFELSDEFFLFWLGYVETLDQLLYWISYMLRYDMVPDERQVQKKLGIIDLGGVDCKNAMARVNTMFGEGSNSKTVGARNWMYVSDDIERRLGTL